MQIKVWEKMRPTKGRGFLNRNREKSVTKYLKQQEVLGIYHTGIKIPAMNKVPSAFIYLIFIRISRLPYFVF